MSEVTGSISGQDGVKDVRLNNAATEATLRLLLQSSLTANRQTIDQLKQLGVAGGLFDPVIVEEANANIRSFGKSTSNFIVTTGRVKDALGELTNKLTSGTAQSSDVLSAFSNAFGDVFVKTGVLATAFSKLAKVQEENFLNYQKLSASGASFGGSLTDLRIAAAKTYLTFDEFTSLMKSNSTAFAQLGGSVNSGAVAFSKFSNTIMSSVVGKELMALGYTTAEANQSMITYLAASGVSNTKDLATNKSLRDGAALYLEELDRLAQVTGKSRQEQDELMKKQKLDAEIQMTAARMPPEARANFEKNVAYMTERYGDAGKDMALAQAQNRSVITKAGGMLVALAPGITSSYQKMVDASNKFGVGSKQYIDAQNEMSLAAQQGLGRIPTAVFSANDALKGLSTATLSVTSDVIAGRTTKAAFDARDKAVSEEIEARKKSEAADIGAAGLAFKKLGASLLEAFAPFMTVTTTIISYLGKFADGLASVMNAYPDLAKIAVAIATIGSIWVAWQLKKMAVSSARGIITGAAGAAGGGAGVAGGAAGAAGGGVGRGISSIGKGVGAGLRGMAVGLRAFASPQVMLGAVGFGVAIAAVGAGIAAAAWLTGKALPTLAEGLTKMSELDGERLGNAASGTAKLGASLMLFAPFAVFGLPASLAMNLLADGIVKLNSVDTKRLESLSNILGSTALGVAKLGASLLTLAPFAVFGLPAGLAMNSLADGLVKLNSVDPAKLERVAIAMQKVKDATPTVGESVKAGVSGLVSKITGTSPSSTPVAPTIAKPPESEGKSSETLQTSIETLNKNITEMLRYARDTAEHTKRTYEATRSLNGNLWAR